MNYFLLSIVIKALYKIFSPTSRTQTFQHNPTQSNTIQKNPDIIAKWDRMGWKTIPSHLATTFQVENNMNLSGLTSFQLENNKNSTKKQLQNNYQSWILFVKKKIYIRIGIKYLFCQLNFKEFWTLTGSPLCLNYFPLAIAFNGLYKNISSTSRIITFEHNPTHFNLGAWDI